MSTVFALSNLFLKKLHGFWKVICKHTLLQGTIIGINNLLKIICFQVTSSTAIPKK